jgi:hypothetical protein
MEQESKFVCWQDGGFWLGYSEEYPDYLTQGMSLQELHDNLKDIYTSLASNSIPCARQE